MKRLSGKLTYANVVATLAIFLVLAGGTAFAAKQMLPKNSVGGKQIKNNAITGAKIKNGAVTGAKIAPGTISGSNINSASLGTVPNAVHAGTADIATSATKADSATTASTATNASHATSADSATTAGDANSLGGIPASGFMTAGRFAFGSAGTDSATEQTLFSLGGLEVRTVPSAGNVFKVRLRNTNTDTWEAGSSAASPVFIIPGGGGSITLEDTTSRAMQITAVDIKDISRSITIQCGSDNGPDVLFCFAQISPAS
jgi:hypothetical protein